MPVRGPPTHLSVVERTHESVRISWTAPASTSPIVGYEVRVGAGLWVRTRTSAPAYVFEGLAPDTEYSVRVRAISASGPGPASAAFAVRTLELPLPGIPRFPTAAPAASGRAVRISWVEPAGVEVDRYEYCVILPTGIPLPWESAGDELSRLVRGLAAGHRYGFRIRAVNAAGPGLPTEYLFVVPREIVVDEVPDGAAVPLLDVDRQSLIVRIANVDVRLRVWWQPADRAWYASAEVPVNSPATSSKRLAANAPIFAGVPGVDLAGDLRLRVLDAGDADPARDAWRRPTHALVWEAAAS